MQVSPCQSLAALTLDPQPGVLHGLEGICAKGLELATGKLALRLCPGVLSERVL